MQLKSLATAKITAKAAAIFAAGALTLTACGGSSTPAASEGGVQLINFHSSWYSLRNCLEYFFWFRSRLHLHAQKGFIPLGGNTVFVRTDLLPLLNSIRY